jgi:hypothetical protein
MERSLMEALGTGDYDFGFGLIQQLANAGLQGRQIGEDEINFLRPACVQ